MASASFLINAGSSRPVVASSAQTRRNALPAALARPQSVATPEILLAAASFPTSSSTGGAFSGPQASRLRAPRNVIAAAEASGSEGPSSMSSLKETAALDELIDKLLQSRSQQEVCVAKK